MPWVVDECTTVDGIEFVALKRNDTGFVRYILGKSNMTLRDYIFVDEMRKARNKVRFEMLTAEEKSLFSDRKPSQYELRKKKHEARLLADDISATPILEVPLPKVTYKDVTYEAHRMKMLCTDSPNTGVSIEFTKENLQYVRAAVLHFGKYTAKRSRTRGMPSKGLHWVKSRGYFRLNMEKDGTKSTMVVRPRSLQEHDLDEAQEAAIEFMGMDVDEAREAIDQWHRDIAPPVIAVPDDGDDDVDGDAQAAAEAAEGSDLGGESKGEGAEGEESESKASASSSD